VNTEAFAAIMASLDAPLAVVTAAAEPERAGCLIGFHAQSSIDPGRYCVWLSKANHTYRVQLRGTHLAIHYLTEHDRDLAEVFGTLSGDDVDKFSLVPATSGPGGVPVLGRCPNRLVVKRTALLDEGGDHVCVVSEVVEAHADAPFRPLRVSDVGDLVAGHESDERPSPPTERAH